MRLKKNQGQSTTEYLLVTLLASVFVMILVVQLSPGLKETLDRMQDSVAMKIAGGKLVGHIKPGGVPAPGASVGSAVEAPSPQGPAVSEKPQEGAAPETGQAGGGVSGARGGDEPSFLRPSDEGPSGPRSAEGASEEASEGSVRQSPRGEGSSVSSKSTTVTSEKPAEQKGKKEGGEARSSGQIYAEGDEEGVFRGQTFDWLRLLIILLIVIVVAYISFEIYKAMKLGRPGK